ncbi:MAG: CBS domain-containing protein [Vampirovibrio sp.]|nr:CBS domain-containing protein [Vampirovibrio sp.]
MPTTDQSAKQLTVKDVMTSPVVSVQKSQPLKDVYELLNTHYISGLPVKNSDGDYIGVISKTDLISPFIIELLQDPTRFNTLLVEDVIKVRPLMTISKDAPVEEALRLMAIANVHRLFVEDENQDIVGVVSGLDCYGN